MRLIWLFALFVISFGVKAAPTDGYTQCAPENGYCVPLASAQVIYGAGTKFTAPIAVSNAFICNNATFADPNIGVPKACWLKLDKTTSTTVSPNLWSLIGVPSGQVLDNDSADLPACIANAASSPSGSYSCTTSAAITVSQSNVIPITLPDPGVMSMHGGLNIDPRVVPPPKIGESRLLVGNEPYITTPLSDIGAFRTVCGISKLAFDDPIVYPGQPGKAHLHTFAGNVGIDAFTTPESLRNTGNSTCSGGIANRSAYWIPTMIDVSNGLPIIPPAIIVYYKMGYDLNGPAANAIRPMPEGLRMIAGDPSRTTPGNPARFLCLGGPNNSNDHYGPSIPDCDVGADVEMQINFPQCWDGVNLDSPDHKSHMASASNGVCPATHPVALPQISYQISYRVTSSHQALNWRLSSDGYEFSKPAGYSAHGDWYNGWNLGISNAWGTIA